MPRWYVVNTRPKKESQVERLFTEGGFTIYCPKYVREKRVVPFFPGYAFLQFEFPDRQHLQIVTLMRNGILSKPEQRQAYRVTCAWPPR